MKLRSCAVALTALVTILALGGETLARPQVSTRYTYYSVSGSNAIDLYNAMIRRGPHANGSKAYATTTLASGGKVSVIPGKSCRIHFQFALSFTMRLPKISNEAALNAQTRS